MKHAHVLSVTSLGLVMFALACSSGPTSKGQQAAQRGADPKHPSSASDPNGDLGTDPSVDDGEQGGTGGTGGDAGARDGGSLTDGGVGTDGGGSTDGGGAGACAPATSGWRIMASLPDKLQANFDEQVGNAVWTGTEMLMFGYQPACDGKNPMCPGPNVAVAYDGATDSFHALPLPVFADHVARIGVSTFWTGHSWLLFGGSNRPLDGLSYDPVTKVYTVIPPAPLSERGGDAVVWSTTTHELIVWGGGGYDPAVGNISGHVDGAAFDPIKGTWRKIADAPLKPRSSAFATWDGTRMIAAFGWLGHNDPMTVTTTDTTDAAAYDPAADKWTVIASPPVAPRGPEVRMPIGVGDIDGAFWGGEKFVTPDTSSAVYYRDGAFFNEAAGWTTIPAATTAELVNTVEVTHISAFGKMMIWGGSSRLTYGAVDSNDGALFDPATGKWTALPAAGGPSPRHLALGVWTGCDAIVWGGGGYKDTPSSEMNGGRLYRP